MIKITNFKKRKAHANTQLKLIHVVSCMNK